MRGVSKFLVPSSVAVVPDSPPDLRDSEAIRSFDARLQRVSHAALWIGGITVLASLVVAMLAYASTKRTTLDGIYDSHLHLARALASSARAPRRDAGLQKLQLEWADASERLPGRYLCTVDGSGEILLHTNSSEMVGRRVDHVALTPELPGSPQTVGELIEARGNWVGINRNVAGQEQVAAYAWSHDLEAMVVVHVPMASVNAEIRAAVLPWALAFGVIALLLFPLTVVMLYRALSSSRSSFLESHDEETRLRFQLDQAQKLEDIGRLAGSVSHDFNNILTAILGYCDQGQKRATIGDEAWERYNRIRSAGERASELTRQLLAFSSRQNRKVEVLDLNRIVGELGELLTRLIDEDIHLSFESDDDICIRADRSQMEQVILNLVVNARDAMPDGGQISVRCTAAELDIAGVRGRPGLNPGSYVMMRVVDTGVGMDSETKRRAFEPLFSTKGRGRGMGLGLSTVYGIVRQNGGDIRVESTPGAGTEFEILLPRAVGEEPAPTPQKRRDIAQMGTERILLAEDEDSVRQVLADALREHGYAVMEARNGPEALTCLERSPEKIDLLITDLGMPGMRGEELAQRVRAVQPNVRTILTSGYTYEPPEQVGPDDAPAFYLPKPFSSSTMLRLVRKILGEHEAARLDGLRTLVIDDDDGTRKFLRLVLEEQGCAVMEAGNGKEGLDQLRKNACDLVITDIVMPEMEGLQTCREITRCFPQAKIIAISGVARGQAYLDLAQELGAVSSLPKPFSGAELLETIERVVVRSA